MVRATATKKFADNVVVKINGVTANVLSDNNAEVLFESYFAIPMGDTYDGIDRPVDDLYTARDGRRKIVMHFCGTDRLRTRDQAQRTFNRKGKQQLKCDNAPKQDIHPLGYTLKCKTEHENDQHQPTRRNA